MRPLRNAVSEASALAARLPALIIQAEFIAETVRQGTHGRRRAGTGENFWQFRPYEHGDSVTRIDWRQSAKGDRLYVREREWQAAHSVYLWCDRSRSMDYTSQAKLSTKADYARLLALALSSLLLRGGEIVGLLGSDAPPVTAGQGDRPLLRLAEMMETLIQHSGDVPFVHTLPRHADIVLIGDFLNPLETLAETINGLAQQGRKGHILQILDPAEVTLPFAGRVRFAGLEGEDPELIPRADTLQHAYRERLGRQQHGLEEIAKHAGWGLTFGRTDQPAAEILDALYLALLADR